MIWRCCLFPTSCRQIINVYMPSHASLPSWKSPFGNRRTRAYFKGEIELRNRTKDRGRLWVPVSRFPVPTDMPVHCPACRLTTKDSQPTILILVNQLVRRELSSGGARIMSSIVARFGHFTNPDQSEVQFKLKICSKLCLKCFGIKKLYDRQTLFETGHC